MAAAAGLLALALPVAAALPVGAAARPAPTAAAARPAPALWVVQVAPGRMPTAATAVARAGGTVTRRLRSLDVLIVTATPAAAQRIGGARTAGVVGVTADSPAHLLGYGPAAPGWPGGRSLRSVERDLAAPQVWRSGATGAGVDVALLDSGVSRVGGLDGAGKVAYGPDLTTDASDPSRRNVDGFGHGTHVAGIIAGSDSPDTTDPTRFQGIAPQARIVSVKVATANGATSVSTMLAGMDWVILNRSRGYDLRVLNLSFGTDSTNPALVDPIAAAVERVWASGIAVVVSAGNEGRLVGHLLDPAYDPYVIAVGAEDTGFTGWDGDDAVAAFSSRGDGRRNPDLVAPGVDVESLRVPGSTVDRLLGTAGVSDPRYLRGTGTSQAAGVVSGSIALLLQARPSLTNDQVKQMLRSSAVDLRGTGEAAEGAGALDLPGLVDAPAPATRQSHPRSTGAGSPDAAGGSFLGKAWAGKAWAGKAWASIWA